MNLPESNLGEFQLPESFSWPNTVCGVHYVVKLTLNVVKFTLRLLAPVSFI